MSATLQRFFAVLGVKTDPASFGAAKAQISNLQKSVGLLKSAVGGAFVGFGLAKVIGEFRSISREADGIAKASARVGVSGKDFQALAFAAQRSGASTEELALGLQTLQRNLGKAGLGGKEQAEALGRLGLSFGQIQKMDPAQQFRAVAGALGGVSGQGKKAALAQALLGRGAARLIPLFNAGEKGLAALEQRFADLGGGFDEETLKRAEAFEDSMTNVNVVMTRFKIALFSALFPLKQVADYFTAGAKGGQRIDTALRLVAASATAAGLAFMIMARKAVVAWLASVAPMIPVALLAGAAIFGLALVLEDAWVAINGGKSVFGWFVQWIESTRDAAHSLNAVAETLNGWFGGIGIAVADLLDPFMTWEEKLKSVVKLIGQLTGFTDFFRGGKAPTLLSAIPGLGPLVSTFNAGKDLLSATTPPNPALPSGGNTSNSITMNIDGAKDPEAVGREVQRVLSRELGFAGQAIGPRL